MSVIIKGLNKPHSCGDCWLWEHCDRWRNRNWGGPPPSDCPLVQVPPHGDLIDRDVLTDAIDSINWYHQAPNKDMVDGADSAKHQAWYKVQDVYSAVDNAPTIIPAEDGKDTNVPTKEEEE